MLLILGNTWRFQLCNVSYEIEFCKTGLVDAAMGVSRASFQLEAWSLYGVPTPAAVWWIMTQTSVLETSSIYSMKHDDDNGEEKSKEIIEQER